MEIKKQAFLANFAGEPKKSKKILTTHEDYSRKENLLRKRVYERQTSHSLVVVVEQKRGSLPINRPD